MYHVFFCIMNWHYTYIKHHYILYTIMIHWIKNIKRFPVIFVCFGLLVCRMRRMTSMSRCLQFLNLIFELIRNGLWRSMVANVAGEMWHWWWHYSARSWAYIVGWATSGYHLPPSGTVYFLFRVVLLLPWQGNVFLFLPLSDLHGGSL